MRIKYGGSEALLVTGVIEKDKKSDSEMRNGANSSVDMKDVELGKVTRNQ